MKEKSARRGTTAYIILAADVVALIFVLGIVLQTLSAHVLSQLKQVAKVQQKHWLELASLPCVAAQTPPEVPELPDDAGTWEYVKNLKTISENGSRIWSLYVGCQEPKTEVIKEDLLHFKVDKYDEFEKPPEPAYDKIYSYVDQNLPLRSEIYISGHTDTTGTDQHNFALSYQRALHVMAKIDAYLRAKGKVPGVDYRIYPLGMGKSQLLKRTPGKTENEWLGDCRRIALSFRSRGMASPEQKDQ